MIVEQDGVKGADIELDQDFVLKKVEISYDNYEGNNEITALKKNKIVFYGMLTTYRGEGSSALDSLAAGIVASGRMKTEDYDPTSVEVQNAYAVRQTRFTQAASKPTLSLYANGVTKEMDKDSIDKKRWTGNNVYDQYGIGVANTSIDATDTYYQALVGNDSPTHIYNGSLVVDLPIGRDMDGNVKGYELTKIESDAAWVKMTTHTYKDGEGNTVNENGLKCVSFYQYDSEEFYQLKGEELEKYITKNKLEIPSEVWLEQGIKKPSKVVFDVGFYRSNNKYQWVNKYGERGLSVSNNAPDNNSNLFFYGRPSGYVFTELPGAGEEPEYRLDTRDLKVKVRWQDIQEVNQSENGMPEYLIKSDPREVSLRLNPPSPAEDVFAIGSYRSHETGLHGISWWRSYHPNP